MTPSEYVKLVGPWAPIYTHVARSGQNIHIGSALLHKHLRLHAMDLVSKMRPLPEAFWNFVENNEVSLPHIWKLRHSWRSALAEPIIMCASKHGDFTIAGRDHMLVDGRHRYCLAFLLQTDLRVWLVSRSIWRDYEIKGLPSVTAAELRAEPIFK